METTWEKIAYKRHIKELTNQLDTVRAERDRLRADVATMRHAIESVLCSQESTIDTATRTKLVRIMEAP